MRERASVVGPSISHYNVLEKLGQGGMREVYRAEDTKLSRQVAIKVLPEEYFGDANAPDRNLCVMDQVQSYPELAAHG